MKRNGCEKGIVNRKTLRVRDGCIMAHDKMIIPLYYCLPWERCTAWKFMFATMKEPEPILSAIPLILI